MKEYILMADIINSGEMKSKKLMTDFKNLVNYINNQHNTELFSPLTITLGDEFQGVVASLKSGIDIIIALEEHIVKMNLDFKLRYVLNLGKIDTPINTKIAHAMLGEGLTDARFLLAELKKTDERFLVKGGNSKQNTNLANAFIIYQDFLDSWSVKEFRIVSEFLKGENYKEVANILTLDVSTAWRREKSLKMKQYNVAKKIIYSYLK